MPFPHLPLEPPHGCRSLIHSLLGRGRSYTSRLRSYQLPQAFHQAWYDETYLNWERQMEIQKIYILPGQYVRFGFGAEIPQYWNKCKLGFFFFGDLSTQMPWNLSLTSILGRRSIQAWAHWKNPLLWKALIFGSSVGSKTEKPQNWILLRQKDVP